mmetsp:Transcript_17539/g.52776  ORF Transcript_17539/g.52776 Transcript_17539/m.52776 type:complete len:275 (+) Transcript_17539:571-1395(+)
MEPSAAETTSVPNCRMPTFLGSFFMICTRWPAVTMHQSSGLALGTNRWSSENFLLSLASSCFTRYTVRSRFWRPAAAAGMRLCSFTDLTRSSREPVFRYLGLKPAKGPKSSMCLPLMMRLSRCGTDMGGAPMAALPYTLFGCFSTTSGFWHTRNSPLMGKPMKPLISGMPDFCSISRAQPPAPTNTNLARTFWVLAPRSFFLMVRSHLPSASFFRPVTAWKSSRLPPFCRKALPSSFVRAPKSTSVPTSERVRAILSPGFLPSIMSGHHCFIFA